ncbi:MAG: hypothetical protein A2987_06560 [Omnitrophica bacterium RIFCSPLOWO2_01_FULL_45_10]|nr:MAG: hypothetical protein A2987_06560 [Omnitrophica bacterium RIFCSPLOWO2_01_FULL_45_10]
MSGEGKKGGAFYKEGKKMKLAQCDIIIPVFNRLDVTKNCLGSIYERTDTESNLILIDNGSDRETRDFLDSLYVSHQAQADAKKKIREAIVIHNNSNKGWVKAVNQGLKLSLSPYICIMNNDTVVRTDDWLSKLIDVAELEKEIGLVNPRFDIKKKIESGKRFVEIDFCRGYCILIKRSVVEKIGLFDESYGLGYYDDDDYSVRASREGFKCVRANEVFVEHLRDSTFSALFEDRERRALHENNKTLFYSKWGRRLKIVFIVSKTVNENKLSHILFSLARKQHIVYLWNPVNTVPFEHINIRQHAFPRLFYRPFFPTVVFFNKMKKEPKRYNLVFSDDIKLSRILSKAGAPSFFIDIEKDNDRIDEIVDVTSKV